ncbi:MAG: UDP-N-acetylmuramate--L-alanine ligase, partial [Clostridia bacterium]|nr:UDP-N-acetylmuramate--L-alanine ligase [Clostridia bacterium]
MALPNTHMGPEAIGALLDGKKNLFFDGIGGISMNSLAHISALRGHHVSGYDRSPSPITRRLEQAGITVYYEEDAVHMQGCDALIYTVAMGGDNPEYRYAGVHGIPRISRADYLGYIMSGYRERIGISGTHGKSTTTGMVARILSYAGTDPTVFNGAEMKETGTVDRIGGDAYFAFEACEYMDSFLDFCPTIAIVLNIELDHVDYFPSLAAIKKSFTAFMNKTGKDGCAIVNANDPDCLEAAQGYTGRLITFGNRNPLADYWSANITTERGRASFDVMKGTEKLAAVHLQIPGKHNISDALAAFAACHICGIDPAVIAEGLGAYEGICRRMDLLGQSAAGADVYADYAHHPTEIEATLSGAAAMG